MSFRSKHLVFSVLIALCLAGAAFAQAPRPVVRILSFEGDAMSGAELKTMERLITSYIVELGIFRVVDSGGQEMALQEAETAIQLGSTKEIAPLSADYLLGGTMGKLGDSYVFTLEVTKVASGEKRSQSETGAGVNEFVLKSRALTRSLFGKAEAVAATDASVVITPPQAPGSPASPIAPSATPGTATTPSATTSPLPSAARAPSLKMLEGQWRGDRGIDKVRIFKDGTGLAFFANGATMKIRVTIEGDTILVTQNQPNAVSFYQSSGVPFAVAKQIAAQARPVRWIMSLGTDGRTLFGRKETISATVSGGVVTVDNSYIREAIWERM